MSSFNSVNSAWMHNMPKMAIIITIILIAIMIKVFKYQFAKGNIAVYQGIENFGKEVTKIYIMQDKTGFQKYQVSVTAIAKLMAANLSILISTNLDQNLSKANDEGSSHFVFIYIFWELLYLTVKVSLLSSFLDVYLHGKY